MNSRWLAVLLLLLPWAAWSKPLVADLSDYRIAIDTRFSGANLLLFGARGDAGDVVVVIRGPDQRFSVRRKERVAGMWANAEQVDFAPLPIFYAVAANRPIEAMNSPALVQALGLHERALPFEARKHTGGRTPVSLFEDAFLRRQHARAHYADHLGEVRFLEDSLFRATIPFPNTLLRGMYTAEVYLLSEGQIVGMQTIPLQVNKVGFDAFAYEFAHRYALLYGIMAVVFAAAAGLLASNVFKRLG